MHYAWYNLLQRINSVWLCFVRLKAICPSVLIGLCPVKHAHSLKLRLWGIWRYRLTVTIFLCTQETTLLRAITLWNKTISHRCLNYVLRQHHFWTIGSSFVSWAILFCLNVYVVNSTSMQFTLQGILCEYATLQRCIFIFFCSKSWVLYMVNVFARQHCILFFMQPLFIAINVEYLCKTFGLRKLENELGHLVIQMFELRAG